MRAPLPLTRPSFRPYAAVLLALSAGLPLATSAQAAASFQLPPAPSATPETQGPALGDATPRAAETSASPPPAPSITPSSPAPATSAPATSASAPANRTAAAPRAVPTTAAPTASASPAALATPAPAASSPAPVLPSLDPATGPSLDLSAQAPAEPAQSADSTPWLVAASLALLALLAGLGWLLWRRRRAGPEMQVPVIERPRVAPAPAAPEAPAPPAPAPEPEPEPAALPPLSLALEARQLSLTLLAASLTYRLTLTNNSDAMLSGVVVSADMIAAHAALPREQQLANEAAPLPELHRFERIGPGLSVMVSGELRLPLPRIHPITRGGASLFVPLARLRVAAQAGLAKAMVQTVLIGQRPAAPGGGLQPFRLDLGPRIWREVTQKIFG